MESFWRKQGNRVAMRVNLARWLEWAAPGVAAWGVVAGCVLLLARRHGWDTRVIALCLAILFLIVLWVALRRARGRWFSGADGLTRLDAVLGLNNRLASAAAGVGDWPPAVTNVESRFRWRWDRVLFPPLLGGAFLMGAVLFPIAPPVVNLPLKIEEPLAWGEVEAALDTLKKEDVADPESLAALEQKLEALRAQPEEAWYGQSSLEAGAALRQETGAAISRLERKLDAAGQALAQMNSASPSAEAAAQWAEALRALETGALPMEGSQLAKLKDFKAGAGQVSAEQLQQMLQELNDKAGEAGKKLGSLSDALKQNGGECEVKEGEGSSGEPGPGGGHDPLGLKSAPTALQPATEEALPQGDAGRAALGDVVKRSAQAPEVDPSQITGPTDAGSIGSSGAGGEAVWKSEITPAERSVLRRFFK